MRVVQVPTPAGSAYRIYRGGVLFSQELCVLARFLRQAGCSSAVAVSDDDADPDAVLVVGPLGSDADSAFRRRFGVDLP